MRIDFNELLLCFVASTSAPEAVSRVIRVFCVYLLIYMCVCVSRRCGKGGSMFTKKAVLFWCLSVQAAA